ncbi:MAG: polyprenyl synthetase family protein [Paludibacteraceae bacterium]|nr:polyprenyl synthetase family protein [Paludibacteraceae bacterium]
MDIISQIKKTVLPEFADYEQYFSRMLETDNVYLKHVLEYVRTRRGKQLRPLLVLLAAKLCGKITETTIQLAVSVELLHTASLLHDDVVDSSLLRRGQASVNAEWNNKTAVLVGDYLLAKSLELGVGTSNPQALKEITKIGQRLASGELLQLYSEWKSNPEESVYFEIIKQKTAALFNSCMQIGAISVGANDEDCKTLGAFGEYLGICFQLKDDYFDFQAKDETIGKPVMSDVKEGKITLPLLVALRNAPMEESDYIKQQLQLKQIEDINAIHEFVVKNNGLTYTVEKMNDYKVLASQIIEKFTPSTASNALSELLSYAIERTI